LRAAGNARSRPVEETAAEIEAFHLIQRFRIQQQLKTSQRDAVNRINPKQLNELHRLMLKESFRQAKKLQLRLRQQFGL
jgi:CBS domain-containing protein